MNIFVQAAYIFTIGTWENDRNFAGKSDLLVWMDKFVKNVILHVPTFQKPYKTKFFFCNKWMILFQCFLKLWAQVAQFTHRINKKYSQCDVTSHSLSESKFWYFLLSNNLYKHVSYRSDDDAWCTTSFRCQSRSAETLITFTTCFSWQDK